MNDFRNALNSIKADENLKNSTIDFVYSHAKKKTGYYRLATVAACILLFVSLGFFASLRIPVSSISIDINPSIELELNIYKGVISAKSYNDDGKQVINGVNVHGMNYSEAVSSIINSEEFQLYIQQDSLLVITVSSNDKEEIVNELETKNLNSNNPNLDVDITDTQSEIIAEAHSCGMSFGKYQLYLTLIENNIDITLEDVENMTMRQLKNLLEDNNAQNDSQITNGYQGGLHQENDETTSHGYGENNGQGNGYQGGTQQGNNLKENTEAENNHSNGENKGQGSNQVGNGYKGGR